MTFDEIRQIALSFPEVEEYRSFNSPSFRIRKRFLACIARIDPDTLVLKVPDQRERRVLPGDKAGISGVAGVYT